MTMSESFDHFFVCDTVVLTDVEEFYLLFEFVCDSNTLWISRRNDRYGE